MWGLLRSKAAPYIAAAVGFALLLLKVFSAGRKAERTDEALKDAKANDQTHNRIDQVPAVDPADDDDVTDRLRKLSGGL